MFLNHIIRDTHIRDLSFINTEVMGMTEEDSKVIVDIACIADDGSEFIVDMQNARQKYKEDNPDETFSGEEFDHLFELANFATFTPEQYEEYQQHENMKYDYQNCLDYQYSKGRKEGLKEGMEKGHSSGLEEGYAEKAKEIAKTCLEMGMDIPMISTITKLPEEDIQKLK